MSSRYALVRPALAIAVLALPRIALADGAADFREGVELYNAGDYTGAVVKLARAYEDEPKPETLFALAQAERNAGNCQTAAKHYRQLLDLVADLNIVKAVQQNLSLCETDLEPPPRDADPPAPEVETKIVVREVNRFDKLGVGLVATGTLCLGAAIGLHVAAGASEDAAASARSIPEYDRYADRADLMRTTSIIIAAAGAGLIGYGVFRLVRKPEAAPVAVSVSPSSGGGRVFVSGRW